MTGRLDRIGTRALLRALDGRHLHPIGLMAGILAALYERPGRIISTTEIVERVYGDDPDGGSLWATGSVSCTICTLRKRGVPIVTHGHRGYSIAAAAA